MVFKAKLQEKSSLLGDFYLFIYLFFGRMQLQKRMQGGTINFFFFSLSLLYSNIVPTILKNMLGGTMLLTNTQNFHGVSDFK